MQDRKLANETTRRLAATTDAELVAGIRTAVVEVLDAAAAWHAQPDWEAGAGRAGQEAWTAAERVQVALAGLGGGATVAHLVNAVRPVLGVWWPEPWVDSAVGRLRAAALHRPRLVQDVRRIVSRPGWEDW